MSDSRTWTRTRFFLALLLAALVAGAVPIRVTASRGDKSAGGAAWRASSARPIAPRPDLDLGGTSFLAAAAPEPLPIPRLARAEAPPPRRVAIAAPPLAQSPLPRAPPVS
ncbi:hypothetical protein [Longimicrobium sp.]|uniref:hypothetical protein n=1 Tax=Longimicrobium sp. TaxID=2029185 RepID=UPI003B3A1210